MIESCQSVSDRDDSGSKSSSFLEISGYPHAYLLWTRASLALDRYDEGAEAALKALSEGANFPELHEHLIAIAFLQGNDELVRERLDAAAQRESSVATLVKAKTAAFKGQMRTAEQLFRDAIQTAESQESRVLAAAHFRDMAETLAAANRCTPAQEAAEMRSSKYSEAPLSYSAPFVFGLCGNAPRALEFVAEELRNFPEGTLHNNVTAPIVRGLIELRRGNAADAIEQFHNVPIALERQQGFLLWFARGEALLKLNRGAEASVEFQKIIDHRGTEPLSPRYPLSYLGLARSRRQAGDITGSRQAYEQFLALWKDADADLTYLIEAKREYQSLAPQ